MPRKKNDSENVEKAPNAYFISLELENVRCFGERQKILFSERNRPKQWTIILGDNGTGKTTILQSLIGLSTLKNERAFENEGFYVDSIMLSDDAVSERFTLKDSKKSLNLALRFRLLPEIDGAEFDAAIRETHFKMNYIGLGGVSKSGRLTEKYLSDSFFCFGYGASRKTGESSLSFQKEASYKTLFEDTALLLNPEEWLLLADYAARRESEFKNKRIAELELVKKILIGILPDVDEIRFGESESARTPKPIVEFHTPYGWVEAKDLSLGYRTSMAWMVDFASRMFDRYPNSENPLAEPAVVLIDEIDLHLHPKWQRELLDYLSNLFPNTQFIVTTHSPLVVQSAVARDANIVVCRREGDHVVIDQSVEAVKNWRADQILTSDFFGLETARPKEIEDDLRERQKILSKAKLTKKDEKRLKELEDEIGLLPVGENAEDDKAMDIIRRAAARLQSEAK